MVAAYVGSTIDMVDGSSYTPDSGTDTLLVWQNCGYKNLTASASGQTFDAVAMAETQDLTIDLSGGGDLAGCMSHLASPGTSSGVLDVTWTGTFVQERGIAMTLSGVDQTTPEYPTNGNISATYTTATSPSLTYDAPAGSVIVYWKLHRQPATATFTLPTGFTQRYASNMITNPANIDLRVWTKDQATAVTGATISSTTTASTGGIHGVMVYQAASGGGGFQAAWAKNSNQTIQ